MTSLWCGIVGLSIGAIIGSGAELETDNPYPPIMPAGGGAMVGALVGLVINGILNMFLILSDDKEWEELHDIPGELYGCIIALPFFTIGIIIGGVLGAGVFGRSQSTILGINFSSIHSIAAVLFAGFRLGFRLGLVWGLIVISIILFIRIKRYAVSLRTKRKV